MTKTERYERFRALIAAMFTTVNQHQDAGSETRTGVWVCIWEREFGEATVMHESVGTMSPESSDKRKMISRRKIDMLHEGTGAETTYELRDPERGRWGGGFTIGGAIDVAVSGLPEKWDMACGLLAANHVELIGRDEALRLAAKADGVLECVEILERFHGPLA